jgi:hypothetical protein
VSYSFQWSYPNCKSTSTDTRSVWKLTWKVIPLPPHKIHGIWKAIKHFEFDSTYGAFQGQNVTRRDLKEQVLESMKIFCKVGGHESAGVYEETIR